VPALLLQLALRSVSVLGELSAGEARASAREVGRDYDEV
jgi:hypothetical protein